MDPQLVLHCASFVNFFFSLGVSYYTGADTYTVMAEVGGSLPVPEANKKDIWVFDADSDTSIGTKIDNLYVALFSVILYKTQYQRVLYSAFINIK